MRISDWSSDVCSSDLEHLPETELASAQGWTEGMLVVREWPLARLVAEMNRYTETPMRLGDPGMGALPMSGRFKASDQRSFLMSLESSAPIRVDRTTRSEEHTSELPSLMRISY